MSESLFLVGSDNVLKPMRPTAFETEDVFQDLLARSPDLLTDSDFGEGSPRRWMLVSRETSVPDAEDGAGRWSLDHLFLDQDGVPTLVEVKRATDTRVRREVVAQMLDYAANAARWWRADELARTFAESSAKQGVDPSVRIGRLLGTETPDAESFWRSVQANLGSGRIRMVFVADRIPSELERIVEFLNEQMNPATVLALELRPFASGPERILAPRLIGLTSRASTQNSVASPRAPAASVQGWFADVLSSDMETVVRHFVDVVRTQGASVDVAGQSLAIEFGTARTRVAYVRPTGRVALSCWMLAKTSAFKEDESRMHVLLDLEAKGFTLSSRNTSGEPTFSLPDLDDFEKWARLTQFVAELVQRLSHP